MSGYGVTSDDNELAPARHMSTYTAPDSVKVEFSLSSKSSLVYMSRHQRLVRKVSEHLITRSLVILLIFLDLILAIVGLILVEYSETKSTAEALEYVSLTLSILFVIEIGLRFFGLGVTAFFSNWVNILDMVIILITFMVEIVTVVLTLEKAKVTGLIIIMRLIRVPRFLNFLRMLYTQRRHLLMSSRKFVSENKSRYESDGFDLDLCYITENIIAMSFPSSGLMALYRNPIGEVGRFLDEKHPDVYKVYNMCSERTYDTSYFHDRVERVMIDDHNPPRLKDMITFAKSTREWVEKSSEHVIVVHCKGGKGRTGTMICTHLVDMGIYNSAEDSLIYFGERRTDLTKGKKFQGVETPSQSRYVGYFEKVMKELNYELPPVKFLKISKIILRGLELFGNRDGSDISFEIFLSTEKVFEGDIGYEKNCKVSPLENEKYSIQIELLNSPELSCDVKLRFYSRSKRVPCAYESCAFFFWFYTSFVDDCFILKREELDNPHKPKTWKSYSENFAVELYFEEI